MNKFIGTVIIVLCLVTITTGFQWKRQDAGIREKSIKFVAAQKANGFIFIGTDKSVYISTDFGKAWRNILTIQGWPHWINFIAFDPWDENSIFVGTQNGLYKSQNSGKNWQRAFSGTSEFKQDTLCLLFMEDKIYLGTRSGLFISQDRGKTWLIQDGQLANLSIKSIAQDTQNKNIIYLATSRGVYKTEDNFSSLKRIFANLLKEKEIQDDQETYEGLDENEININQILIDSSNPDDIYLATTNGIFLSKDKGLTWQRMNSEGLIANQINWLVKNQGRLFAGTDKGVFEFKIKYWENIYKGLTAQKINCMEQDKQNNLWLASENGLFQIEMRTGLISNPQINVKEILESFQQEPAIQEIQKVAINYAEVSNDKIKAWHRQAQMKALMPELTLDYDKTITTALGTTYDRVQVGPRDWGMNLKWDISELVWNNDQTSIDSRSRLMVQLRDDILNEITRLYFERRRLQAQLLMSHSGDSSKSLDDELRLQELTASIDALTGGYLSRRLEQLNGNDK